MATLDLTTADEADGFVIYFGGKPSEVDAYTFANALVATADAFREINAQVNPGFALELRLEAVGEGSFKARVREKPSGIKGLLRYGRDFIVMPIFVTWFYTTFMQEKAEITVNTDEVIIQNGKDRIIVPRSAYDQAQRLPNKEKVSQHVARALTAVERDPSITSFGILKDLDGDEPPAFLIERDQFAIIRAMATTVEGSGKRSITEPATISILKAIIEKSDRKWEFVWRGVKISAAVKDPIFWADLKMRRYLIGSGDALEVQLQIDQLWDDDAKVWLNGAYSVVRVDRYISADQTDQMDF